MAHAAEHTNARARMPKMSQARVDRTAKASRARAVTRGPPPRPGRRAAPDPQRRPRPVHARRERRAEAVVALPVLRARMAGPCRRPLQQPRRMRVMRETARRVETVARPTHPAEHAREGSTLGAARVTRAATTTR